MGSLVLVRHGATAWNQLGKYQGQQDISLSSSGLEQAEKLAFHFRSWSWEAIYASDLSRAYDTALEIAKINELSVITDQRLREYSFGVWEGLTRDQVKTRYPDLYDQRLHDNDTRIDGGETAREVQLRVSEWFTEIINNIQGQVMAVSHGGTIRTLLATILDTDINHMRSFLLDNCGYSIVHWDKVDSEFVFKIECINRRA